MNDNEIKELRQVLQEHLRQCAATNAEVQTKLRGIIWLLGTIAGAFIIDVIQRLG